MFSFCLCSTCDCVLLQLTLGQYHYMTTANVSTRADSLSPSPGAYPGKDGSPSRWEWADAGRKLTAFQYANFLCLFICFLMTPGSSREGIFYFFFPSVKKTKTTTSRSFFLLIVCHWPIKVKDRSNFEWKVFPTLEMDAFESLPFNTNKCLCHSCPVWHTYTHTFRTSAHTPSPPHLSSPLCSSPALIRVMPTHHSTMG